LRKEKYRAFGERRRSQYYRITKLKKKEMRETELENQRMK
jgi:hypothetical protein